MFGIVEGFNGNGFIKMSAGLESPHSGYLMDSPGSPPASLADMISRNKILEGMLISGVSFGISSI